MSNPLDPIIGFIKPMTILIASLYIMAWVSRKDYTKLTRYVHVFLYASWGLILMAFFVGTTKGGASRWLELGPISFMPSDMAKLCLTISLSKILSTKQSDPKAYEWGTLLFIFLNIIITCTLILLSNFSTSVIIFLTSLVLMFFGRVPIKFITSIFGIVCIISFCMIYFEFGDRATTVKSRIKTYYRRINSPSSEKAKIEMEDRDKNFQLTTSLYAISTGALSPKGPGKSQYRYHLSQSESDFVFAIIIEEYSIAMGAFVVGLFLVLIFRSLIVTRNCERPLGGLMSAGLSFSIVTQALINMFVSVGAIPVTGQPIPMVSAGGTSLFFTAISIGLILSISKDNGKR
jgi:cell division protein FtsW